MQNKALTLVGRLYRTNQTLTGHFHNFTGHFQRQITVKADLKLFRQNGQSFIKFVQPKINNGRKMASGDQ